MMRAELKVVGGKHEGQIIPLSSSKFLIGREQDCHLRPSSELVSRHHCVFSVDDYGTRLRDLGSTNGTLVNDERIHGEVSLNPGDIITVGKLVFELVLTQLSEDQKQPEAVNPAVLSSEVSGETSELSSSETVYELSIDQLEQTPEKKQVVTEESQEKEQKEPEPIAASPEVVAAQPQIPVPQQPVPMMQPPMMPYPQQPNMGYPMGYPQMPQQPMYGYPQQPMPYQQPMGYPVTPPQPQPVPEQQDSSISDSTANVILPDPATTGAKPPEPKAEEKKDDDENQPTTEDPSSFAADIIKKHMTRRPGL